jgi:type IV secretory pathway VirB10-like protein
MILPRCRPSRLALARSATRRRIAASGMIAAIMVSACGVAAAADSAESAHKVDRVEVKPRQAETPPSPVQVQPTAPAFAPPNPRDVSRAQAKEVDRIYEELMNEVKRQPPD